MTSEKLPIPTGTSQVTVSAKLLDSTGSIDINGVDATSDEDVLLFVVDGDNLVTFTVTAEDGVTTAMYDVNFRVVDDDASLSSLSINVGSITFDQGTPFYEVDVSRATTSVVITAAATSSSAALIVHGENIGSSGSSSSISLDVFQNNITVLCLAEDLQSFTYYTIGITREPDHDASVSSLVTDPDTAFTYSSGTPSYSFSVMASVDSVSFTIVPTFSEATSTVNDIPMVSGVPTDVDVLIGDNVFEFVTKAEDGVTETIYTVTVHKQSDVATLKSVDVSEGEFASAFVADSETDLTFSIVEVYDNVSSIVLTPTATNATASITVDGGSVSSGSPSSPVSISLGENPIDVVVTSEDASETLTYTITVTQEEEPSSDATLTSFEYSHAGQPSFVSVDAFSPSTTTGYALSVANTVTSVTVSVASAEIDTEIRLYVNGEEQTEAGMSQGSFTADASLLVDANDVSIEVYAPDLWNKEIYTLTVTRARSTVTTIGSLSFSGDASVFTPSVEPGTSAYSIEIGATNGSPQLTVITTNDGADVTLKVNGGSSFGPTSTNKPEFVFDLTLVDHENTITVEVTAEDGIQEQDYIIDAYLISDEAGVATASLDPSLSFVFDTGVSLYMMNATSETYSVIISATTVDTEASLSIDGGETSSKGTLDQTLSLVVGMNRFNLTCTAEDGVTTEYYSLHIDREASDSVLLNSITTSAGSLSFADDVYSLSVDASVSSLKVLAIPEIEASTLTVNEMFSPAVSVDESNLGDIPDISLDFHTNTIILRVTAEDGLSFLDYTIRVYRESNLSSLSQIISTSSSITPSLTDSVFSYTLPIPATVDEVVLTLKVTDTGYGTLVFTNSTGSLIELSANGEDEFVTPVIPLQIGIEIVKFTITAEDGATQSEYTVNIDRTPSTNADLKSLTVTGGSLSPAFSGSVTTYSVLVDPEFTTAVVAAECDFRSPAVVAFGDSTGNSVSVGVDVPPGGVTYQLHVTAEDTSVTKSYTITINRLRSSNSRLGDVSFEVPYNAQSFDFTFDPETTQYSIQVGYNVDELTFLIEKDHKFSFVAGRSSLDPDGLRQTSLTQTWALSLGSQTINLLVTAENGEEQTYSFVVNRNAATEMRVYWDIPSGGFMSGEPFSMQPHIKLFDQLGFAADRLNGSLVSVQIQNNAGEFPGVLSGTLTTSVEQGEATFEDVSIDRQGVNYTLRFSVTTTIATISEVSDPFTILAGSSSHVEAPTSIPTSENVSPNTPISPPITLRVTDAFENTVFKDSSSTATIAIERGPENATIDGQLTESVVDGVVSFDDVSLSDRGSYTLNVSVFLNSDEDSVLSESEPAMVLVPDFSVSFDFEVGDPKISSLTFEAQPLGGTGNSPRAGPTVVYIRDNSRVGGKLGKYDQGTQVVVSILDDGTNEPPVVAKINGEFTTVTLTSVDGEVDLSGLTVDKVGSYRFVVTVLDTNISVTSDPFTITVGEAAQVGFVWDGPGIVEAGETFFSDPSIQLLDAGGNPVTEHGNFSVHLSLGRIPSVKERDNFLLDYFSWLPGERESASERGATPPLRSLITKTPELSGDQLVDVFVVNGVANLTGLSVSVPGPSYTLNASIHEVTGGEFYDVIVDVTVNITTIVEECTPPSDTESTETTGSNSTNSTTPEEPNCVNVSTTEEVIEKQTETRVRYNSTYLFSSDSQEFDILPNPATPPARIRISAELEDDIYIIAWVHSFVGSFIVLVTSVAISATLFSTSEVADGFHSFPYQVLQYITFMQLFILNLEHNSELWEVFNIFHLQRTFIGNTADDDEDDTLFGYSQSFLPKGISLVVVLILMAFLPGTYVRTCCIEFRIYKTFFVLLLLFGIVPLGDSILTIRRTDLTYVWLVGSAMLLIFFIWWSNFVHNSWSKDSREFYELIPEGKGFIGLFYQPNVDDEELETAIEFQSYDDEDDSDGDDDSQDDDDNDDDDDKEGEEGERGTSGTNGDDIELAVVGGKPKKAREKSSSNLNRSSSRSKAGSTTRSSSRYRSGSLARRGVSRARSQGRLEDDEERQKKLIKQQKLQSSASRLAVFEAKQKLKSWKCQLGMHSKNSEYVRNLDALYDQDEYEEEVALGNKLNENFVNFMEMKKRWMAYLYRPLFETVVMYRPNFDPFESPEERKKKEKELKKKMKKMKKKKREKLKKKLAAERSVPWLTALRAAFSHYIVMFKILLLICYVCLVVTLEGIESVVASICSLSIYLLIVIVLMPYRNPYLHKEILYVVTLIIQFSLLLDMLVNTTHTQNLWGVAIVQLLSTPLGIYVSLKFKEKPIADIQKWIPDPAVARPQVGRLRE